MVKKHKLKYKAFYCKLHNNYRYDGECNEMACEFCDEYYEKIEKEDRFKYLSKKFRKEK